MPPKEEVEQQELAVASPPAAAKPKRQRKKKVKEEEEFFDGEEESGPVKKKPKTPRSPTKPARKPIPATVLTPAQQEVLQYWQLQEPSLLYRASGPDPEAFVPGKKIAAFDFDGTLVAVKGQSEFPLNEHDWVLFNKEVPRVLSELVACGYKIVIFSNQNGIKGALAGKASVKLRMRLEHTLEKMEVEGVCAFFAAQDDQYRKPQTGMWDFFCENCNGDYKAEDIDKEASFFVGDAAGRDHDIGSSDREFAAAVGIDFKLPEDVFGEGQKKKAAKRAELADGEEGHNKAMADAFQLLAETAENQFAQRAIQKAADIIRHFGRPIKSPDDVKGVKGIGKGSINNIKQYLATGTILPKDSNNPPPSPKSSKQQQEMLLKFI